MDPYIGKILNDRYEIQSLIGQGTTSVVYKAHCRRLDRTVAIKILNEELSNDENLLAKFYEESSKVAALSQANIVDIYDINQHENIHYIVMEYLDGISLKQFIAYKHLLTWNETIYFSIQILKALEYAHAHDVVHHDLKPQNVMIMRDGSVKVTDFAIAHLSTTQSTLSRSQLDSTYYLSPEQTNGGTVETRSDLYSLGIMMYEMLTGKVPYSGTSSVSVAVQHVQGGAIPPRKLQPNIPIGLQQITMHAMSSDIRYRYNTAYGMKKDLETLQQNPRVGFRYKEPAIPEVKTPAVDVQEAPAQEEQSAPDASAAEAPDFKAVPESIKTDILNDIPEIDAEPTVENEVPVETSEASEETIAAPEPALRDFVAAMPEDFEEIEAVEEVAASEASEDTDEADASKEVDEVEAESGSEVEAAARVVEEELFNTGELDTDFSGLWAQFSQQNESQSENADMNADAAYDASETEEDTEGFDDEEEYDDDDDEDESHHSIAPIIIIVLIVLILAVVGFFFRSTIAEYAVKFWNIIKDFFHNL